ncbi:MAG: tetratricopeptide repeat protein [Oligoflexales bacterium]
MWKTVFTIIVLIGIYVQIVSERSEIETSGLSETFMPSSKQIDLQAPEIQNENHDLNEIVTGKSVSQTLSLEKYSTEETSWISSARKVQVYFASGGYVQALEAALLLRSTSHDQKLLKWIERELPTLLDHAAWSHLRLGRCEKAIGLFNQVISLRKTVDNSYGFAFCARKLGRIQQAYEHLHWNLAQKPDHRVSWLLYAEVLESLKDFQGALEALRQADELRQDTALQSKIQAMQHRSDAVGEQRHEQGEFFRVSWPRRVELESADLLNWIHLAFEDLFARGYRKPKAPIEIFLYERDDFHDLVPGVPGWVDGLFDGRLRIPVHTKPHVQRLESVLRHELSHALIAHMSDHRRLPTWLDEGFAQRASCFSSGCEPFQYTLRDDFPKAEVLEASFTTMSASEAKLAYSVSFFLIRWLELKDTEAWHRMLAGITHNSRLDSDSLVVTYGRSFQEILDEAEIFWKNREALP